MDQQTIGIVMRMDQFIRENRWFDSAILFAFIMAFAGATCNHVTDMVRVAVYSLTLKDAEKWNEYRNQVPATLEPWGAELVLRGKLASILTGEQLHTDTVVIRFPNTKAIDGWYASPAYQSLIPLRKKAPEIVLLSYDG